jgi:subtilisin family serine protease
MEISEARLVKPHLTNRSGDFVKLTRVSVAALTTVALGCGGLIAPALVPNLMPAASAATQRQGAMIASLGLDKSVPVSKYRSYVVLLKEDPLLGTFSQDQLDTKAAATAQADLQADHDAILDDANVPAEKVTQDLTVTANGFAVADINHAAAVRLAADPKVAAVVPDELRTVAGAETKTLALSPGRADHDRHSTWLPSGKNKGHGPSKPKPPYKPGPKASVPTEEEFLDLTDKGEAYDAGLDGSGVLVGVIDTGIWPEHPSFADDGTFPAAPVRQHRRQCSRRPLHLQQQARRRARHDDDLSRSRRCGA